MAKTASSRARSAKDNAAANLVEDYFAALEAGREKYGQADQILEELLDKVGIDTTITTADGQEYSIVDLFATKNKVWKPCGVSRYALEKKR